MLRRSLLALGAALPAIGPALAQPTYPTKPIRLVVGYTPGGGNDLIARIVAAKLQDQLGQPVVVDNKPGAQSIVAAEIVAKAAPDGYTLLIAPSGPMTINPAVYAKLPYDPVKDFAPISLLAEFPLLLAVGAEQPMKSVKELVEFARANPKLANYASSATPFQLAGELFNQRTGSSFQHIPYRGSGDAVQAVAAGQVLMTISDSGPMAGPLSAGKLRALAITTAKRPPAFPDVPTFAEAGIADMEIELWTGIVAPAGTPAEILERLQDAVSDTIDLPAVHSALEAINVDPRATTVVEFRELIARDAARWKAVAAKANIRLD
jgi:tripartite-type tricarboxylate transporter receptor subunit TctC